MCVYLHIRLADLGVPWEVAIGQAGLSGGGSSDLCRVVYVDPVYYTLFRMVYAGPIPKK